MMKALTLLLLLLLGALRPAVAADTLRPEQLGPGMKGYGLSVFKGTKPERFDVEIIGVLRNALPKQDMILIRLSGADLEKHKVIAGMSGSPVYIDGKLIGALAYGWTFENDPLAGVTPIHNMMAELKLPTVAPSTINASVSLGQTSSMAAPFALPNAAFAQTTDSFGAPHPLLTPLSLGGFSSRVLERFASKFMGCGMMPIAAGGAGARTLPHHSGDMEPGGAIGVQLIRGDMDATAVGTATYVEKNRILAFGHPFFQGGSVQAPAVSAEVHTIMSSLERSFKMASPIAEIGSMVGDWQSCIVADAKVQAQMIPVSIDAANRDTGQSEHYDVEVMNNQVFTPQLVLMAIAQAVSAASGSSQDTTVRISVGAELAPIKAGGSSRTITVTNTFFSAGGGMLSIEGLMPLLAMFNTPFGSPTVKRVDVKVDAALTRQTAEIKRAYFDKSELQRGERTTLKIVLKPFGRPEVTKTIPIDVPAATDTLHYLVVTVVAGNNAPPDAAPPDSLDEFLDFIQQAHHNTDLVALSPTHSQGMQYHGKLLKKLPPSAVGILDDSSTADVVAAADISQLVEPTDWVLSGQATVRVPIRQE
ncbi:MAG TPA: SpoIVB peptidase S55 domain-containing protein [Verrucomicrobiae bacterium]|nr:SpoIVB peptidase S55 domain-containing protein [Verrucomicrobiae bacterium]